MMSAGMMLMVACADRAPATLRIAAVASVSADSLSLEALRCEQLDANQRCALYGVTVAELVARPRDFHGKRVRVLGFVNLQFECNGLYSHQDDLLHGLIRNGLWIEPTGFGADSVNNHYVLVEATFDAIRRGHFAMWSGSLHHVTRINRWDRPAPSIRLDAPVGTAH